MSPQSLSSFLRTLLIALVIPSICMALILAIFHDLATLASAFGLADAPRAAAAAGRSPFLLTLLTVIAISVAVIWASFIIWAGLDEAPAPRTGSRKPRG